MEKLHERSAQLSAEAARVWQRTLFGRLESPLERVIAGAAVETPLAAGEVLYNGAVHDDTITVALVTRGLLRIAITAPDGRAMTIRFCMPGETIGLRALATQLPETQRPFLQAVRRPLDGGSVTAEAVVDSQIVRLPLSLLLRLARKNAHMACAIAATVAEQAMRDQERLATNALAPVLTRVALHLLSVAYRSGDALIVEGSHKKIADSVGTVREVVSRALVRLQGDGVIKRRANEIHIIDAGTLHQISQVSK